MNHMALAFKLAGYTVPACVRKKTYPTRPAAEATAQHNTAKRGWRLHAYHCEACRGWHLTRMPRKRGSHE